MPNLIFRKKDAFLSMAGLLGTAGALLIKFWTKSAGLYIGDFLSLLGIGFLTAGSVEIAASAKILNVWNSELLLRSLAKTPPTSTIRVMQTSIPDVTRLIGALEEFLIHKDKLFRLRVLLLDYENAYEVLLARVRHRVETADAHAAEIRANVDQFIELKRRVDSAWQDSRSGAKLDLQIRLYSFLPFGSVWQFGEEVMFSGIFWNWTSSINGPMIAVRNRKSNMWHCIEKHFTTGWEEARAVFPRTLSGAVPLVVQQLQEDPKGLLFSVHDR